MKTFNPELYVGKVYHKRFVPRAHDFMYSTFFIKISLFNLENVKNHFFSVNRFNLFSFNFSDHGFRDGTSLVDFANKKIAEHGFAISYDDIIIHTYPRILGFVFNPVSFWYFQLNGEVVATLVEVNNTFGETTSYLLTDADHCAKVMQVSPFNQIRGSYQFNFHRLPEFEKVDIKYLDKNQLVLFASVYGKKVAFSEMNLLKLFVTNPFVNICAVLFIHFEALRLYLKKIPFFGKNGVVYDK